MFIFLGDLFPGHTYDEQLTAIHYMLRKNKIATPIESISYVSENSTNYKVIGGSLTLWKGLYDDQREMKYSVLPQKTLSLNLENAIPSNNYNFSTMSSTSGSGFDFDFEYNESLYEEANQFLKYDDKENLIESVGQDGVLTSSLYGYGGDRLIAQAINASASSSNVGSDWSYLNFESPALDNDLVGENKLWTITGTEYSDDKYSGMKSVLLNYNNTIYRQFKPRQNNKKFIFSAWVKTEQGFQTNKGQVVFHIRKQDQSYLPSIIESFSHTQGDWKYIEYEIDLKSIKETNQINGEEILHIYAYITNGDDSHYLLVDDVMFRPKNTLIKGYSYQVGRGLLSQIDANQKTMSYEYGQIWANKIRKRF